MVYPLIGSLAYLAMSTAPTNTVLTQDIVIGSGQPAQLGSRVVVQFEVRDDRDKELANTWKRGLAYSFVLGDKNLPRMWLLGLSGMKRGGKRIFTAQPADAYGDMGVPPVVGPSATLKITVELTSIDGKSANVPVK